jgi:hypothetical protein
MANLTPDSMLQSIAPSNIWLRDLMGQDAPPLSDDNQPLCLSFHIRQGCWSTCKQVQTHTKALTVSEKQRIAQYLLAQMAKRPGTATPSIPP